MAALGSGPTADRQGADRGGGKATSEQLRQVVRAAEPRLSVSYGAVPFPMVFQAFGAKPPMRVLLVALGLSRPQPRS